MEGYGRRRSAERIAGSLFNLFSRLAPQRRSAPNGGSVRVPRPFLLTGRFRQQGLPKPPSGLPALQWARHSQPAGLLSKNGAPTPYPPPKEGARGRELPNHVLLSEARSAKSKHHRIRNKVILRLRLTPPLSMTNLNDPPSVTAAPCHPPPTGVGLGGYDGIRKPRGDEKIVRLEERLSGNSSKIVE